MSEMIPVTLIPAGINDQRSRDFIAALSAVLEDFQPASLLVQDPMAVDARLLPIMTVELAMSDFMTPGMLERHVRALLDAAPDIHALTGTVAGARRALSAIGVTVDWVQWFQQEPPASHDTHVVTAYVNEHLFADQAALLTEEVQQSVLRLIHATQRWSQEIDFRLGVGFATGYGLTSALQGTALIHPSMSAVSPMPAALVGAAGGLQHVALVSPSAVAVSQHPAAALAAAACCTSVQFLAVTMEAVA